VTSRDDIVAALTAAGLDAHATITGPIVAGMAWPAWRNTRWANAVPDGVRLGAWYVFVALPNGAPDVTVAEADPLVVSIGAALISIGLQIEVVEPYSIPVEEGTQRVPVLRYSVND
jgi:hypothetical protein